MNANPYISYYKSQIGGSIPVYSGIRYQRGHGFFSNLVPIFKKVLSFALPILRDKIAPSAVNLVTDVVQGENVLESLKKRGKEAGTGVVEGVAERFLKKKYKRKHQKGRGLEFLKSNKRKKKYSLI